MFNIFFKTEFDFYKMNYYILYTVFLIYLFKNQSICALYAADKIIDMQFKQGTMPPVVKANLDHLEDYNNFKMATAIRLKLPFIKPIGDCDSYFDGVDKRYIQRTLKEGKKMKLSTSDIISTIEEVEKQFETFKQKLDKTRTKKKKQKKGNKKMKKGTKVSITKRKPVPYSVGFTYEHEIGEERLLIDRTGQQPSKVYRVTTVNAYFEGELVGTLTGEISGSNENFKFLYNATNITASVKLHETSPNDCVTGVKEEICVGRPVINPCNKDDIDKIIRDDDFRCKKFGSDIHYHRRGYKRKFDISELFNTEMEPIIRETANPVKRSIAISKVYLPIRFKVAPSNNYESVSVSIPMSEVIPDFVLLDEILDEDEETNFNYPKETDLNFRLSFNDTVYEFPVHRLVIYARTGDFLYYLVENSSIPAINQTADINLDINPEIFEDILYFIYQNKILHPEKCKIILLPSWELEVYSLFEKCLKVIKDTMTQTTAMDYLRFAEAHDIAYLRTIVLNFWRNNAKHMSTSKFEEMLRSLPKLTIEK